MDIKTLFGKTAQTYDQSRRQLVPGFDELYGTVLDIFPYASQAQMTVLDLGAGTGLLAGLIATAFPNVTLTLVDISPEMLAQAEARFSAQAVHVTFQVLDFVHDSLPGQFDVIVSALALHHTPQNELKNVFAKIYQALNNGGMFIHLDQILGATPRYEAHYHQTWLKQVRQNGCGEEVIALALERMKADKAVPLRHQLDWLEEVGFQGIECWFKHYRFAVYSGFKA